MDRPVTSRPPPLRVALWALIAGLCTGVGCSIQPIPSIAAPTDVVVSSLYTPTGLVVVAGRAGSVPGGATVVAVAGQGEQQVVAEADGGFSIDVQGETGTDVRVFARVDGVDGEAVTRRIRGADESDVPKAPGAAPGATINVTRVGDSNDVTVSGGPGAVAPSAELLLSFSNRARYTSVEASGAFTVVLSDAAGSPVSLVAVQSGVASAATVVTTPPHEDHPEPDKCEDPDHDDCHDGTDSSDSANSADTADSHDGDDPGGGPDAGEDPDAVEGTDGTDGSDAADGSDATDEPEASDSADAGAEAGAGDATDGEPTPPEGVEEGAAAEDGSAGSEEPDPGEAAASEGGADEVSDGPESPAGAVDGADAAGD